MTTPTFTTQTFRDLLAKRPFQPFRILMSNGEAFEIRHPKLLWPRETALVIGIGEEEDGIPEDCCRRSLVNVAAVEPLSSSAIPTVETLHDLLSKRPFEPFRIVMTDGQAYEVGHPEMALLTRKNIVVGVGESGNGVAAEFRVCSLLEVSLVEPLTSATPESQRQRATT